jgi:hypothetical protein
MNYWTVNGSGLCACACSKQVCLSISKRPHDTLMTYTKLRIGGNNFEHLDAASFVPQLAAFSDMMSGSSKKIRCCCWCFHASRTRKELDTSFPSKHRNPSSPQGHQSSAWRCNRLSQQTTDGRGRQHTSSTPPSIQLQMQAAALEHLYAPEPRTEEMPATGLGGLVPGCADREHDGAGRCHHVGHARGGAQHGEWRCAENG